jgi:hypothetical protein
MPLLAPKTAIRMGSATAGQIAKVRRGFRNRPRRLNFPSGKGVLQC